MPPIYDIPKDELYEMLHVEKRSLQECADHYGCSKRTIQKRMQTYGIQLRPREYELDATLDELIEMYDTMTLHEIGDALGVDWQVIYYRIRDHVEMREQKRREGVYVGENSPLWQGGVDITDTGYIRVRIDGVHKAQHRWIMEDILGRPLESHEVVHHKDCNPANNVPSNLLLCYGTAEHMALHSAMRKDPDLDQEEWLRQYRADDVKAA